ncbi:MAG: IgA Peptidase M64 [candidate division KSB1 bacterium]|nr:IgA Peptidase M64 [candidate division KSB1 bacterium]
MKKILLLCISITCLVATAIPQSSLVFDQFFVDKTMRLDYYHTGIKTQEWYSLDQVYEEPIWAGSKVNLIDTLNLGKYLVKVYDLKTNQLIYSRGFCSIFGEWQTTDEAAKGIFRTFHESVLFPFPKRSVQVVIAARDRENHFQDAFSTIIDPDSRFVNREKPGPSARVFTVFENGSPATKVDLLILGDGYTKDEMKKFREHVHHFTEVLFSTSPFKDNKNDFNVRAMEVISQDSGIDEPRENVWKNTALGCSYNSLDTPRYVLTYQNKALRDWASGAPYDQLYIIVNSERYGGGGIFNLYSTCYSGTTKKGEEWWADYVFVHEFGHAFAGLADEYYSSSVAYEEFYPPDVEPWEPNITVSRDKQHIKWKHLINGETPVPTPWDQASYDSLGTARQKVDKTAPNYAEQLEKLTEQMKDLLRSQKYWGEVGCFEGAGYAAKGLYRPYLDCRMFSKSLVDFDPVCQEAILRVINFYTR